MRLPRRNSWLHYPQGNVFICQLIFPPIIFYFDQIESYWWDPKKTKEEKMKEMLLIILGILTIYIISCWLSFVFVPFFLFILLLIIIPSFIVKK
jgi:cation transport ATPase